MKDTGFASDWCFPCWIGSGLASLRREVDQMRRYGITTLFVLLVLALWTGPAVAQRGHFVRTQTCTDIGTHVECSGKVVGLGGTTFQIDVTAQGTASVECTNPGGSVAPGQRFSFTAAGSSGPLATPRNGQFRYTVGTDTPLAPAGGCPHPLWAAGGNDGGVTPAP